MLHDRTWRIIGRWAPQWGFALFCTSCVDPDLVLLCRRSCISNISNESASMFAGRIVRTVRYCLGTW